MNKSKDSEFCNEYGVSEFLVKHISTSDALSGEVLEYKPPSRYFMNVPLLTTHDLLLSLVDSTGPIFGLSSFKYTWAVLLYFWEPFQIHSICRKHSNVLPQTGNNSHLKGFLAFLLAHRVCPVCAPPLDRAV